MNDRCEQGHRLTLGNLKAGACAACSRGQSAGGWHALYMREWRTRHVGYAGKYNVLTPEERRRVKLHQRYGMTPEDFAEMVEMQGGRCAICESTSTLQVDHSHSHGRRRGLLCGNCNRGLGLFKDDPDHLERAAAYLRKTE